MKVSRDYTSELDTAQKNALSVWKKSIVPKERGFYFFPIVNRGGDPLPPVRSPVVTVVVYLLLHHVLLLRLLSPLSV